MMFGSSECTLNKHVDTQRNPFAHKKDAIAEVKKLIVEYKLTKGDIRGKAIKQLMGE